MMFGCVSNFLRRTSSTAAFTFSAILRWLGVQNFSCPGNPEFVKFRLHFLLLQMQHF
uniref:Uncharacterized protein n=1 Tax=Anguilla anguilla TaxID=7936 RepID=A0A0E9PU67_ANGAN